MRPRSLIGPFLGALVVAGASAPADDAAAQLRLTLELPTNEETRDGISLEECLDPEFQFRLQVEGIPLGQDWLFFFRHPTFDCTQEDRRGGNTDVEDCDAVMSLQTEAGGASSVFVPGPSRSDAIAISEVIDCSASTSAVTLYAIATSGDGTGPIEASSVGTQNLNLDFIGPAAPQEFDVGPGTGNSEITLTWGRGEADVRRYLIFIQQDGNVLISDGGTDAGSADAGTDAGSADAGADAGLLDGGLSDGGGVDAGGFAPTECDFGLLSGDAAPLVETSSLTIIETDRAGISETINPLALGLEVGESAAVAVAAIDEAGNRSVLSDVRCITRVQTVGFCEIYGQCGQGCSCAGTNPSPQKLASSLMLSLLTGASLLFRRRRR